MCLHLYPTRISTESPQQICDGYPPGTALLPVLLVLPSNPQVIATAGSAEKLAMATQLGAGHAINYKTTPDWSSAVLEATGGQGVTVIMDCVGGSYFEQNLQSIAADGRWILYGLLGGAEVRPRTISLN